MIDIRVLREDPDGVKAALGRRGVTTAEVGSLVVPALRAGVQEPTRAAANRYVSQLVAAQCSLENPPPSCPTASTTTTTPTVPVTTAPGAVP